MLKPLQVLLVDDEPMILKSLCRFLEENNVIPTACDDGEQALALINSHLFDVVIADFDLPFMNGLDILKLVQKRNPLCKLIVISGDTSQVTQNCLSNLPGVSILSKPFDFEELTAILGAPGIDDEPVRLAVESNLLSKTSAS